MKKEEEQLDISVKCDWFRYIYMVMPTHRMKPSCDARTPELFKDFHSYFDSDTRFYCGHFHWSSSVIGLILEMITRKHDFRLDDRLTSCNQGYVDFVYRR